MMSAMAHVRKYGIYFGMAGLAGALLAATWVVYQPVVTHDFVDFDDPLYVTENPMIQHGLAWDSLQWAFTAPCAFNWHPLTWISLMLDFEWCRLNAGGYHLTNLLLHMLASVLLLMVLFRYTGSIWRSALVAALFALHPLHVESVAWVSERKDVLSAVFWMLTMLAYKAYAEKPSPGRMAFVALNLGLGLMAKQILVSLPIILLLLDYWPLRRFETGDSDQRRLTAKRGFRLIMEKWPLFGLALAGAVVVFVVQNQTGAVKSLDQYSLSMRLTNAVVACARYLWDMVWPSGLACFYPFDLNLSLKSAVAADAALIAISMMALCRRNMPFLAVGWLWYLVALLPVIGIVQIGGQARADRYTYLPLIGAFIIIAWSLGAVVERISVPARRRMAAFLIAVCMLGWLAFLGFAAHRQVGYWRNTIAVFSRTIEQTVNNSLAYNNRANAHAAAGRHNEAIRDYTAAIRIKPDYSECHNNLGVVLAKTGMTNEALWHYGESLRLNPKCAETFVNIGTILFNQGRLDEAMSCFADAVRLNSALVNAHYNLAVTLGIRGRWREAAAHFWVTWRYRPTERGICGHLIGSLMEAGDYTNTVVVLATVAERAPEWLPDMEPAMQLLSSANLAPDVLSRLAEVAQRNVENQGAGRPGAWALYASFLAAEGDFNGALAAAGRGLNLAAAASNLEWQARFERDMAEYKRRAQTTSR